MQSNHYVSATKISHCHITDLKIGDILLFRPSQNVSFSQKMIMFGQSLIHNPHGHYDTVHVALCTGKNNLQQSMIAHVTNAPAISNAFLHEPLQTMLDREGGDRPFLIYRPKHVEFAQRIGDRAKTLNAIEKFTWSFASAATTLQPEFFYRFNIKQTTAIDKATFCSRFVIQVMKNADKNQLMKINSRSTPKTFEKFLATNTAFEKKCYLGSHPYVQIENEIQKQVNRLKLQTHTAAKDKFTDADATFQHAKAMADTMQSESEKTFYMLNEMLPILKINTGWGLKTATSFTAVSQLARKMGIFKKDVVALKALPKREMDGSGYHRLAV